MRTHKIWLYDSLGYFAVRLEDGQVTGIHGPLSLYAALGCDLPACPYDEMSTTLRRAREQPERFVPVVVWRHDGVEHRLPSWIPEPAVRKLADLWSRVFRALVGGFHCPHTLQDRRHNAPCRNFDLPGEPR